MGTVRQIHSQEQDNTRMMEFKFLCLVLLVFLATNRATGREFGGLRSEGFTGFSKKGEEIQEMAPWDKKLSVCGSNEGIGGRWTLSADGSLQPYNTSDGSVKPYKITQEVNDFEDEFEDGSLNKDTGIFTAPVAGLYDVSAASTDHCCVEEGKVLCMEKMGKTIEDYSDGLSIYDTSYFGSYNAYLASLNPTHQGYFHNSKYPPLKIPLRRPDNSDFEPKDVERVVINRCKDVGSYVQGGPYDKKVEKPIDFQRVSLWKNNKKIDDIDTSYPGFRYVGQLDQGDEVNLKREGITGGLEFCIRLAHQL